MRRIVAVLVALAALVGLAACGGGTATLSAPTVTVTETVTAAPSAAASRGSTGSPTSSTAPESGGSGLVLSQPTTDLPTMTISELPPEAIPVLEQIASGGPFEYREDGQTFQNREGLLPPQSMGYYREYTVETPGSPTRGARRFVVGANGAVFYTQDHYRSFREVIG